MRQGHLKSQQNICSMNWNNPSQNIMDNSPACYEELLNEYLDAINLYKNEVVSLQNLHPDILQQHSIRLISNDDLLLMKEDMRLQKSDCLFSVLQARFNGLEYLYEILIGPFLMKIMVLNLNRDSDDGDEDIDKLQIGTGGFGSVRAVRVNDQQFAIKRISFKYKLEPTEGYDFEAQTNQQYQLRRCLREFCIFKICSLLEIGPRLIDCSYDLICFNNCIEFRMQLCQPITSNQFYANHREVSLMQMRGELMAKMAKLHSLKIVHRDIKPDNILYSPERKAFLLGDFGLNIILQQELHQRTFTKFAGTVDYCGPEMRLLLGGQSGYVNLYLNDYLSLKQTLNCLQSRVGKESSEISMNNMSYNQQNFDNLSDFQNFSMNDHSNGSYRSPTDTSYPSTGNSLINFTTATTEAPKKLATAINHHESEIIFQVCRRLQRHEAYCKEVILRYIDTKMSKNDNIDLLQNLFIELSSLFIVKTPQDYLVGLLRKWKNSSRHYGPSSQQTIQVILQFSDYLFKQKDASVHQQQLINAISQQILSNTKEPPNCEQEMKLHRILGQTYCYNYSFINFLRTEIRNKQMHAGSGHLLKRAVKIAKQYLFCIKSREINYYQIKLINSHTYFYFNDHRIISGSSIGLKFSVICFQFLKERGELEFQDLACYILYKLNFEDYHQQEIKDLLQQLKLFYHGAKDHHQKSIIMASLTLLLANYPQVAEDTANLLKETLQNIPPDNKQAILVKLELLIYYNSQKMHSQTRRLGDHISAELDRCKGRILHWDYYHIIAVKVVAQSYIYSDLQRCKQGLKMALEEMIRCYGRGKYLQEIFQIMNNLAYVYSAQNKHLQMQKCMKDLRTILQDSDQLHFKFKRVYVYQELINSYLKLGIQNEEDKAACIELVNTIVDVVYRTVPPSVISRYNQLLGALPQSNNFKDIHFIEKEMLKSISMNENYKNTFLEIYLKLCLSISKYLVQQLNQYHLGLKYLWKYIEIKEKNFTKMTEFDFEVYNLFTNILMKSNSYRRAIIFLKKYIFKIPVSFFTAKKQAFALMHKASVEMNEKMMKIYYELIKHDSTLLFNKHYSTILAKEKSYFKRMLLQKWLQKV